MRVLGFGLIAVGILAAGIAIGQTTPPPQKAPAPQPTPIVLPPGEGKDIVANACSQCHDLSNITSTHLDRKGWEDVVNEMVDRGADLTDAQIATIVDYLAKNFPKPPEKPAGSPLPLREVSP